LLKSGVILNFALQHSKRLADPKEINRGKLPDQRRPDKLYPA